MEVLKTTKYSDNHGCYVVQFSDGVDVEFSASGLEEPGDFTSCAFFIRGMSPHLSKFMLEVAKAGNMVILPAMEPFVPILSRPEQRKELPAEFADNDPEPVLCASPEELEILLSGGYAEWQKYRDQISRRNNP